MIEFATLAVDFDGYVLSPPLVRAVADVLARLYKAGQSNERAADRRALTIAEDGLRELVDKYEGTFGWTGDDITADLVAVLTKTRSTR
jgi:hypothetical protein